ncbi:MAG: helix-turn-helix transcriptional regulator [Lachnospiraceae bacterium]|nr:helix-turn-helix transcriptional regulator [Lachnospiraceae bacterium]
MKEFDVVNRIKELCESKEISFYKLSKISDIPQTTLTNMLNRGTVPSIFTLEKICTSLDISMSQFFDTTCGNNSLTEEQADLLDKYIKLPEHKQKLARAYIEGLSEN